MDLAGWSRKLRQEQEVRDLSWLMFMEWTLLSRLWWEKLKTEHVERRLWQIGRAQLLRLGWRTSLPLLPTTGYQKPKSEKGTEVRLPKNNYTSVYSFRIEDMFGADDADWAIYRKIVIYISFSWSKVKLMCFSTECCSAWLGRGRRPFTTSDHWTETAGPRSHVLCSRDSCINGHTTICSDVRFQTFLQWRWHRRYIFTFAYKKLLSNYCQATLEFISIPNDGGYARHIFHPWWQGSILLVWEK